jgi:hypothetical protein
MNDQQEYHPALSVEQQLRSAQWQFWLMIATGFFLLLALTLLIMDLYWPAALSGVTAMYALSDAYARLRKTYFELTGITFTPNKPVDTAPPKP